MSATIAISIQEKNSDEPLLDFDYVLENMGLYKEGNVTSDSIIISWHRILYKVNLDQGWFIKLDEQVWKHAKFSKVKKGTAVSITFTQD